MTRRSAKTTIDIRNIMDKQLSGLDPKLKEIYDRVMSTSVSQAQLTEAAKPTPPVPKAPTTKQVPITPQTTAPAPQTHSTAFVNGFVGTGTTTKTKGGNVSMWILSVFAVAFLVIYTLIWIKVFRLQIPF